MMPVTAGINTPPQNPSTANKNITSPASETKVVNSPASIAMKPQTFIIGKAFKLL
jgi:hypothetical protein